MERHMNPEKISEFTLPEEAVLALGAIYSDAYEHGHQVGLSLGLAEKAWLHKMWPLFGLTLFAAGLTIGMIVGAAR
jgi:hypothetical protein